MARLGSARVVVSFAALGVLFAGLSQACAQGSDSTFETCESGNAQGGGAGEGGDSACAEDCSLIQTAPCRIAVCNDGSYPGAAGSCVVVNDDGSACDDGLFCTVNETCEDGVCGGGDPNECDVTPGSCEEAVCDDDTDTCLTAALPDGTTCTVDNLCITGSTCQNGSCVGGTPLDCTFAPTPSECHVSVCDSATGMCEPVPGNNGADCVDPTDLCTVDNTCSGGVCGGGTPTDCSQLSVGCDLGVCNANTGLCETQQLTMGELCDDGSACTTGETCQANSTCSGGAVINTCSQVTDGCCPSTCTEINDIDCACAGVDVNGTCVYVPDLGTQYSSNTAAQAACQGMGGGWDLCSPAMLCDPITITYLGGNGCDCSSASTCACGTSANLYLHVTGANSPYYVRDPQIPNCLGGTGCTDSVNETCGVAICCKP